MKKKILNIWRIISNRYVNPKASKDVSCLLVNDNANSLDDSLGVEEHRRQELIMYVNKIMQEGGSNLQAILKVSKECKHPNELVLIAYYLGAKTVQIQHMRSFGLIR